MNKITLNTWLTDGWFIQKLGRGQPNPITTSLDDVARYNQEKIRVVHEFLGEFGIGSPDPEPWFTVPQHDGRNVIAMAFGAAYPEWNEESGAFVIPGNAHPLAGLDRVEDVARLPLPDWDRNPLVRESRRLWDEVKLRVGAETASKMPLNYTEFTWREYRMSVFPTFLDLGGFLMGATEFMTALASDPDLGMALLEKCFALSASYSDCMCRLYNRPRTSWCTLGGDNSCLVSPAMYREHAMPFDALVREKCGNLPRNLHSCGASRHLYEVWKEYPERERIVLMQTRAIPGAMAPLRASLPQTHARDARPAQGPTGQTLPRTRTGAALRLAR